MLKEQEKLYISRDLNRSAIAVQPKQPFVDWLNNAEDDENPLTLERVNDWSLYLVDEMFEIDDIEKWLKKNFEQIFLKELFAWHLLIENYPQKITYKMFLDWFNYKIYLGAIDLGEEPIEELDSIYD